MYTDEFLFSLTSQAIDLAVVSDHGCKIDNDNNNNNSDDDDNKNVDNNNNDNNNNTNNYRQQ